MLSASSLPLNSKPNYLAKYTKASSSGDAALKVPFLSSMIIVWQAARKSMNERKSSCLSISFKCSVNLGS